MCRLFDIILYSLRFINTLHDEERSTDEMMREMRDDATHDGIEAGKLGDGWWRYAEEEDMVKRQNPWTRQPMMGKGRQSGGGMRRLARALDEAIEGDHMQKRNKAIHDGIGLAEDDG